MPIPIAKLQEARRTTAERILDFLQRHPEEAFTLYEIYATLNNMEARDMQVLAALAILAKARGEDSPLRQCQEALDKLWVDRKVQSADMAGVTYYGILK